MKKKKKNYLQNVTNANLKFKANKNMENFNPIVNKCARGRNYKEKNEEKLKVKLWKYLYWIITKNKVFYGSVTERYIFNLLKKYNNYIRNYNMHVHYRKRKMTKANNHNTKPKVGLSVISFDFSFAFWSKNKYKQHDPCY